MNATSFFNLLHSGTRSFVLTRDVTAPVYKWKMFSYPVKTGTVTLHRGTWVTYNCFSNFGKGHSMGARGLGGRDFFTIVPYSAMNAF